MRSVKFLVAAGAASLLSSAAFAADMPSIMPPPQYYAPPAQDFGGWYLRGDIGFSNQRVNNIRSGRVLPNQFSDGNNQFRHRRNL
jgi:opacity protein-like surface antigen